ALTSVVALQAVGVVLVVAMLIIPGATAYLLTDRFQRMLLIAPAISVLCAIIGLYSSYYLDTASGGMVVLAQGAVFLLVYLFGPPPAPRPRPGWPSPPRGRPPPPPPGPAPATGSSAAAWPPAGVAGGSRPIGPDERDRGSQRD